MATLKTFFTILSHENDCKNCVNWLKMCAWKTQQPKQVKTNVTKYFYFCCKLQWFGCKTISWGENDTKIVCNCSECVSGRSCTPKKFLKI